MKDEKDTILGRSLASMRARWNADGSKSGAKEAFKFALCEAFERLEAYYEKKQNAYFYGGAIMGICLAIFLIVTWKLMGWIA